jgi:hypothetical protein
MGYTPLDDRTNRGCSETMDDRLYRGFSCQFDYRLSTRLSRLNVVASLA